MIGIIYVDYVTKFNHFYIVYSMISQLYFSDFSVDCII